MTGERAESSRRTRRGFYSYTGKICENTNTKHQEEVTDNVHVMSELLGVFGVLRMDSSCAYVVIYRFLLQSSDECVGVNVFDRRPDATISQRNNLQ